MATSKKSTTIVTNPKASANRIPGPRHIIDPVDVVAGRAQPPAPITMAQRKRAGELITSAPGVVVVNADPRLQRAKGST
jgi:hypothetical protein